MSPTKLQQFVCLCVVNVVNSDNIDIKIRFIMNKNVEYSYVKT